MEPADEAGATLAAQWKGLLAHVQALRPLERFRVASVGYRRSVSARAPALAAQLHEACVAVAFCLWLTRRQVPISMSCRSLALGEPADVAVPVLWLLLRPSKLGPVAELPAEELGAPLQVTCPTAVVQWHAPPCPQLAGSQCMAPGVMK